MNHSSSPVAFALQIQVAEDWDDVPSSKELHDVFEACLTALAQALPANLEPALAKEIGVRLCDESESRRLNDQFRGRENSTNVLSFGAMGEVELPVIKPTDEMIAELSELPLGDLAICWPVVGAEARGQDKPVDHHLQHLFIHGVLHLLGFDHEAAEDAEEMEHLECVVLEALHIPNPYIHDTANA